jgi:hypothetical protein
MIHPSVPAKTLKEFVAYAKANANKLSYGSAGAGTMTQLAGELFKQMIGAPEIIHVPYRGAGPSITDLVSGQIPMATINLTGQTVELHRSGKIRILAVTSPERLKGVPHAARDRRPGLRSHAEDHERSRHAEGAGRSGPRAHHQFQSREGARLHRGRGRALDAGGEGGGAHCAVSCFKRPHQIFGVVLFLWVPGLAIARRRRA